MCASPSRPTRVLFAGVVTATTVMALAACSGASTDGTSGVPAPAAANGDGRQLRGICPSPLVVQTSWYPESTHGGLFQLLGGNYRVDKDHKRVTGPLVSHGADTGIELEIRAGGPAVGNEPVSALMATDRSIVLGQQATEDQVLAGRASSRPLR